MNPTAKAIKVLRIKKGYSQREFAANVFSDSSEHSYKKVSRLENGQEPTPEERRLIAGHFGVPLDLHAREEGENELVLLNDEEYFDHQETFLDAALRDAPASGCPVEFWFFHPLGTLPVIQTQRVRDVWLSNLRRGVENHLVWPLPITTRGDLDAFFNLARELDASLVSAPGSRDGKILFWACDKIGGSSNSIRRSRYNELERYAATKFQHVVFNPVVDLDDSESEDSQAILTFDSVALALPRTLSEAPYVVSFLDNVSSEPGGQASKGWLFKGAHTLSLLTRIVERLKKRASMQA